MEGSRSPDPTSRSCPPKPLMRSGLCLHDTAAFRAICYCGIVWPTLTVTTDLWKRYPELSKTKSLTCRPCLETGVVL